MDVKILNLKENKRYEKQIKKLYKKAFPKEERAPYIILKMLAKKEKANFCVINDDEKFVGLIYNIFYKDIVYVFFFAIDDSLRGQGYGSIVLKELQNKYQLNELDADLKELEQSLGSLAYKNTASGTYTPEGNVAIETTKKTLREETQFAVENETLIITLGQQVQVLDSASGTFTGEQGNISVS